jgi:DNA-directed RNA polymerase subunit RPC12/RpoP
MNSGKKFKNYNPYQQAAQHTARGQSEDASFESFGATELYCPQCKSSMPVRERMLLVLPRGELFEYVCVKCAASLGTRTT